MAALATRKLSNGFKDYSAFHKTTGNKVTHYLGIPMIVVSLVGLLGQLPIGDGLTGSIYFRIDGGTILWALGTLWYLTMDWKVALPFSLVTYGCYFLGRAIPVPVNWVLFVAGWVLQFVGHSVFEKKSPAFLTNLRHLLIGPMWIFARLIGYK